MKIEVTKRNEKISRILIGSVPVGFFTGSIGNYTGLFFRSQYDVCYLENKEDRIANWGYAVGSVVQCPVENYLPVNVKIEVQNAS